MKVRRRGDSIIQREMRPGREGKKESGQRRAESRGARREIEVRESQERGEEGRRERREDR